MKVMTPTLASILHNGVVGDVASTEFLGEDRGILITAMGLLGVMRL